VPSTANPQFFALVGFTKSFGTLHIIRSVTTPHSTSPDEFALIDELVSGLKPAQLSDLVVGIGDDCSAIRRGPFIDVYTTDTMVDGVHFLSESVDWEDLGWKSIAVNLSDVAAMGAEPLHTLVTLGIPPGIPPEQPKSIYAGIDAITSELGGPVTGGDIVRADKLFISVTAVGTIDTRSSEFPNPMLRSNAQPGDVIGLAGVVGASGGGLQLIKDGKPVPDWAQVHNRPMPGVIAGQALRNVGVACAIDVSDGLVADMGHICERSDVAATIEMENVPVPSELNESFPDEWQRLAMTGGEDYVLLFTCSEEVFALAESALSTPLTRIGVISDRSNSSQNVTVLDAAGNDITPAQGGWDHLSE
jgi:thiamine-monophosphate kinase